MLVVSISVIQQAVLKALIAQEAQRTFSAMQKIIYLKEIHLKFSHLPCWRLIAIKLLLLRSTRRGTHNENLRQSLTSRSIDVKLLTRFSLCALKTKRIYRKLSTGCLVRNLKFKARMTKAKEKNLRPHPSMKCLTSQSSILSLKQ